jgi:two-component system chemotaxis response regulator CheY
MSKALVVDDSRTIRMILRRILVEFGYEVHEAGDGLEALQVMEAVGTGVELALVDWNMPEMNGLELITRLRQNAELDALKVVMVTTEAELGHMASAMEAGANEYVMKPFTKDILREKLEMLGISPLVSV